MKKLIFAPDIDNVELKRYLLCHAQQETKAPQESTIDHMKIYNKERL